MIHFLAMLMGGGLGAYCVGLKLSLWHVAGVFGFAFGFYVLGLWTATYLARKSYLNQVKTIQDKYNKP